MASWNHALRGLKELYLVVYQADTSMGFKAAEYERELRALVERATGLWRSAPGRPLIYTVSIWTDPNAGVSAVSFDTRANSDAEVEQANAWSKTHYDRMMEEGETEEAKLFHLPRFVRMEEEVAARGAPRDRQRRARIHDASSGHAPPM
jgi:hypothetical protein